MMVMLIDHNDNGNDSHNHNDNSNNKDCNNDNDNNKYKDNYVQWQ